MSRRKPKYKAKSSKTPLIIGIVVLVLALIAAGVAFVPGLLAERDEDTMNTTQPTTTQPTTVPEPTAEPTEDSTEEITEDPTEEMTEPPTEPVQDYFNPLTGERIDGPATSRVFAVTINNIRPAIPHYGVSKADLYFEMFINDYATRGLALYYDINEVSDIGSVRSQRYNFTDIACSYDAVAVYSGGSDEVLNDMKSSGVDSIYAEVSGGDYYYRDQGRKSSGYSSEHCLFVKGPEVKAFAESQGISVTQDPNKNYGLTFGETSSAAGGEDAAKVRITFNLYDNYKITEMIYDQESGLYIYNQYGKEMKDAIYKEKEGFRNVIVVFANVTNKGVYHVADLEGEGKGYFACDGKIIPIRWSRAGDSDTFHFTLEDGTPLIQGVGSSYIALVPLKSSVKW